jgi:hypothetical protein
MSREKDVEVPEFCGLSAVGKEARKCPFSIKVSSPAPSQSYPIQLKVKVDGGELATDEGALPLGYEA